MIIWINHNGNRIPATKNLVKGIRTYKEKIKIINDIEYRIWDPFRSKLAATIIKNVNVLPIKKKSLVLYVGASTGTTISHISDIMGCDGKIFGVEHSIRVAREFINRVASKRINVIPIIADARYPQKYFSIYKKVDVVYCDIAQQNQTDIAIINCKMYLKKNGYLLLIIKTRSIDTTKNPKDIIHEEMNKLKDFRIIQKIDLYPYDKDHAMVIAEFL